MTNLRSLLLAVTLIACGGDDDSGGGGGTVTLAEFGTVFGAEFCAKAFECCTAAEIPMYFDGAPFTTEAECTNFYSGFFVMLGQMYQASIDAGRLEYNGQSAGQCVTVLRGMACGDWARAGDPLEDDCPNPFIGKVANDMSCDFDEECTSGYCEGDVQFGTPMPGVCKNLPTSGQACIDFECAEGLTCENGSCIALKADGASCYDGDECASGGCNGATQTAAGTCGTPTLCTGQ